VLQCVAVCCSVLQCVAVCCSVLQRVAHDRYIFTQRYIIDSRSPYVSVLKVCFSYSFVNMIDLYTYIHTRINVLDSRSPYM